jgi:hypothetical protein
VCCTGNKKANKHGTWISHAVQVYAIISIQIIGSNISRLTVVRAKKSGKPYKQGAPDFLILSKSA